MYTYTKHCSHNPKNSTVISALEYIIAYIKMEYTKKCRTCEQQKLCSPDKSKQEYYSRPIKTKSESGYRYSADCIVCQKAQQNYRNKANRISAVWDLPMNLIDSINKKLIDSSISREDRSELIAMLSKLYDEYQIESTHPYKETISLSSFPNPKIVPSDEAIKDRLLHHAAIRVCVFRRNGMTYDRAPCGCIIRILCKQKLPDNIMDVICKPIGETKLPEPTDLYKKLMLYSVRICLFYLTTFHLQ